MAIMSRDNGYRGIWFTLGQFGEYGDKYSGGLGTYTAKHVPLAVHSHEAKKTFFVYGGAKASERHLLAMVSCFDHKTGQVPRPVIVHDKGLAPNWGNTTAIVNDPHDNPSICIDEFGHIWVFVSGRGKVRPGYKYRSVRPYDIDEFELIAEEEITYPQPWWIPGKGFLHLFTKYTGVRELYWNKSADGRQWTEDRKLAGMGGHYQSSRQLGEKVVTAFNMHIDGVPDTRTNLYFAQTVDMGDTWQTISGEPLETPMVDRHCDALVRDYEAEGRMVYMKDINFDEDGNPIILVITSAGFPAGPKGNPRVWTIAHWTGKEWAFHEVTHTTHNYDMGSLYVENGVWRIIAPTEPGPQYHGCGGEMAMWLSQDEGRSWEKVRALTSDSPRNHAYARRPVNAHPDFYAFWADGNPDAFSESHLYYCNRAGDVWELPYEMEGEFATPIRVHGTQS